MSGYWKAKSGSEATVVPNVNVDSHQQGIPDDLIGKVLYGNDFSGQRLEQWYEEEAYGYFNLTNEQHLRYGEYVYDQAAGTPFHTRRLPKKRFDQCVAIG